MKTDNGDIILPIFNGWNNELVKTAFKVSFDPTEPRGFYLSLDGRDSVKEALDVLNEQGRQIVPDEYWHRTVITLTIDKAAWEYVPE